MRKPALDTLTVCLASGLSGTINGVKPANAPSTVTPAPDGLLLRDSVASAGVSEMAPRLWSMPATIWVAPSRRQPGALSVARTHQQDFDPLSVTSVVSPSRVAMTSLGVEVKVTYAQSGTVRSARSGLVASRHVYGALPRLEARQRGANCVTARFKTISLSSAGPSDRPSRVSAPGGSR